MITGHLYLPLYDTGICRPGPPGSPSLPGPGPGLRRSEWICTIDLPRIRRTFCWLNYTSMLFLSGASPALSADGMAPLKTSDSNRSSASLTQRASLTPRSQYSFSSISDLIPCLKIRSPLSSPSDEYTKQLPPGNRFLAEAGFEPA